MAQACLSGISADEILISVILNFVSKNTFISSPHHLVTIKPTWRVRHFGKAEQQLYYDKDNLSMKKKSGKLVTQQNNCSAAGIYSAVFALSINIWVKDKAITQNMILHLTNLGGKWDRCDADLPQHSPYGNELTYLQPQQKSGDINKEHA